MERTMCGADREEFRMMVRSFFEGEFAPAREAWKRRGGQSLGHCALVTSASWTYWCMRSAAVPGNRVSSFAAAVTGEAPVTFRP
jgi:hypothetical protein